MGMRTAPRHRCGCMAAAQPEVLRHCIANNIVEHVCRDHSSGIYKYMVARIGAKVAPESGARKGSAVRENNSSKLRRLFSSIGHSIRDTTTSIRQAAHELTVSKPLQAREKSIVPTGKPIFKGGKLFWRERFHADIVIFQHATLNYFEVVAIDLLNGGELNRICIFAPSLNALVEEYIDIENLRRNEIHRRTVIKDARLQCSVDYIMESLRLETLPTDKSFVLKCIHYNVATGCKDDLTTPAPLNLIPGIVEKSKSNPNQRDRETKPVLTDLLENDKVLIATATQYAASLVAQTAKILSGEAMVCTPDKWDGAGSRNVNPNTISNLRYRLLWREAYKKVSLQNRVHKEMTRAWLSAMKKEEEKASLPQLLAHTKENKLFEIKGIQNFRHLDLARHKKSRFRDGGLVNMFESIDSLRQKVLKNREQRGKRRYVEPKRK